MIFLCHHYKNFHLETFIFKSVPLECLYVQTGIILLNIYLKKLL